jgi:hypothetical protein
MVPMADMLNHEAGVSSLDDFEFSSDADAFLLKSRDGVGAGREVTISYGAVDNRHLLQYYGFALPNNPDDFVGISMEELSRSIQNATAVGGMLDKTSRMMLLLGEGGGELRVTWGGANDELMRVARILSLERWAQIAPSALHPQILDPAICDRRLNTLY